MAVQKLVDSGVLAENPIVRRIAAVSAGVVGGVPLLDLDYPEDSGCDSDVNLVMTDNGGIVEIQGTAEGATFDSSELAQLLALGRQGMSNCAPCRLPLLMPGARPKQPEKQHEK